MNNDKPYKIEGVVSADEVPNWARRPSKWAELLDMVMNLEPDTALPVRFESQKEADNARNQIREEANTRLAEEEDETRVVRTRLKKGVDPKTGKTIWRVWLSMHEVKT